MCPIRIVLLHQRDALMGQVAHIAFKSHLLASLAKKLETFSAQYQNTEVRKLQYSDSSGYLISVFGKTLYSRGTSIYLNLKGTSSVLIEVLFAIGSLHEIYADLS
jgi:hypothetical protein